MLHLSWPHRSQNRPKIDLCNVSRHRPGRFSHGPQTMPPSQRAGGTICGARLSRPDRWRKRCKHVRTSAIIVPQVGCAPLPPTPHSTSNNTEPQHPPPQNEEQPEETNNSHWTPIMHRRQTYNASPLCNRCPPSNCHCNGLGINPSPWLQGKPSLLPQGATASDTMFKSTPAHRWWFVLVVFQKCIISFRDTGRPPATFFNLI